MLRRPVENRRSDWGVFQPTISSLETDFGVGAIKQQRHAQGVFGYSRRGWFSLSSASCNSFLAWC